MSRVQVTPMELLKLVLLALEKDKVEDAKALLRDAIRQLEESGEESRV